MVRETTMFWSMKMSRASRKPRPMALRMLRADRRSKGARLKMGRSWTLKTGTGRQTQAFQNNRQQTQTGRSLQTGSSSGVGNPTSELPPSNFAFFHPGS